MNLRTEKSADGSTLIIHIEDSVDTVTAPQLEEEFNKYYSDFANIVLDFAKVDYISSAGLRVVMAMDMSMGEKEGKLILRNVNEDVLEVFRMTGFDELLTFA